MPRAKTKVSDKVKQSKWKNKHPHLIITARAGTGKTTTLVEGLRRMRGEPTPFEPSPQQAKIWEQMELSSDARAVCFVAFNKSIATELGQRVPNGCDAKTMHSLGFAAVRKAFGNKLRVTDWRVKDILADIVGKDTRELMKHQPMMVKAVDKLAALCKQNLVDGHDEDQLAELASYYDVDLNGNSARILQLVPQVLERCKDVESDRRIDYNDMIWLPVTLDLPVFKYDLLLCDECLPSWTPVMMGDRSSKSIAEVEVDDLVRSYDTKTGRARNCRVTATHKIANKKPLVKVKVKQNHRADTYQKGNFVVCTTDHKVWTIGRGWTEAGLLKEGDTVIVETAAKTTQKGKITKCGRDYLSEIHVGNTKGIGNEAGDRELFNSVKGGNGRPLPTQQQVLLEELGEPWESEYPVSTKHHQHDGTPYPTCYKIDVANPIAKIAIEIDGASHRSEQAKETDQRKDDLLRSLGWRVFRFKNRDVCKDLSGILQEVCPDGQACPAPATVLSVEETYITENYVYDITVEHCHNFYANGILVHNCQDLNKCQQQLALGAGRRLVLCGDPKQAIYGFAGADADSMPRMEQILDSHDGVGVVNLPLTVTRRCAKAIVTEAQSLVPDFEALEDADTGRVLSMDWTDEWLNQATTVARDGDMLLCRVNAPLVSQCFRFLKAGRKANIQGRDIGAGLISTVNKMKAEDIGDLQLKLGDWLHREQQKESKKRNPSEARLIALQDRYDCLCCFLEDAETIKQVTDKIESIFSNDATDGVKLSSIHKAKGLEADRVFFLTPEGAVCPHPMAKSAWQVEQEWNLRYVAVTRAITELVYVK